MAYKISDTALIFESDGSAILVAETVNYRGTLTTTNTTFDLSPDYITEYFPVVDINRGTSFGYSAGGGHAISSFQNGKSDVIEKWPFSSDTSAADVGDLTVAKFGTGTSSLTHGYHIGFTSPPSRTSMTGNIDKFPFAADGNSVDVGDVTQAISEASSQSSTHGYAFGQYGPTVNNASPSNEIAKFPYSADGNATDVGDLTGAIYGTGGSSSPTHGYRMSNVIDKFPYAVDANAVDVGDFSSMERSGAQQSDTHGYATKGRATSSGIQKVAFASDGNGTTVGDLAFSGNYHAGSSSTENGYAFGGSFGELRNNKFPFASDTNAVSSGNTLSFGGQKGGQIQV